jgi:16S rRNA processing protein RimM
LPDLPSGDYYWHQLQGLNVYAIEDSDDGDGKILLGQVDHLIETGSNDVLVVRKCKGSLDGKERLIPYLPDQVVLAVDLESGTIEVDWDPEF